MGGETKAYSELAMYSILAGSVGIFVKLVTNLDAQTIVFFRAAIATAFILLVVLFHRKLSGLNIVHPVKTLFVGIFQGASIFLYITSLLYTSVSNSIFLLYSAPIFSVILAKVFLKEEIEKETLIGVLVTLAGIIFILNPQTFTFDSEQAIGNLAALGAGFFYAAMALTAKPVMKNVSGYYMAFWQYLVITLIFAPFLTVPSAQAISDNWWQLCAIGILCTGIPFILFMESIRKIKAQKIFIITALEPLAGTILALLVLGETPSFFTLIGAALILYGVYRVTRPPKIEYA